jgi:hypothetical protein
MGGSAGCERMEWHRAPKRKGSGRGMDGVGFSTVSTLAHRDWLWRTDLKRLRAQEATSQSVRAGLTGLHRTVLPTLNL